MAEKRLIDANALLEWLNECTAQEDWIVSQYSADWIYSMIESAPTVDAVEVVHGKWVDKMVRDWHCSVCGKKVPRQVYFDGYCYDDKLNYCPNCGADMRESERE